MVDRKGLWVPHPPHYRAQWVGEAGYGEFDCAYPMVLPGKVWAVEKCPDTPMGMGKFSLRYRKAELVWRFLGL